MLIGTQVPHFSACFLCRRTNVNIKIPSNGVRTHDTIVIVTEMCTLLRSHSSFMFRAEWEVGSSGGNVSEILAVLGCYAT
jgi:hypothetical protein